MVARQLLDRPENIYWLTEAELRDLIGSRQGGGAGAGNQVATASSIEARKETWRGQRRATPPQGLPASRWMDRMESLMPARTQRAGGNTLTGIAASAGTVTAPARVLSGPEDFGTLQPGDVLVASITIPA